MPKPQGVIAQWPVLPGTPSQVPPAGHVLVYYKSSDGKLYTKNSAGVETAVDTGGTGGGGDPIVPVQPDEPAGMVEGELWYDSDDDQFLVDVSYVQPDEPTGAAEGALWLDTDDPEAHTGADHTDLAPLNHTHAPLTLVSDPATSPSAFPDGVSTSYWDATALGTPTPKTNLKTDPSFESGTLLPTSGSVTQSISTDWSATGANSLKLVSTGVSSTGDCYAGYSTGGSAAPMQPGKTYTIAATVNTPVALTNPHTRARAITAHIKSPTVNGGNYVESKSGQGPVTGEARVTLTVDIPADATEYLLRFYNGSPIAGEVVYWDDISITEGPSGDGSTWTVETAKYGNTTVHQTVSQRDATPEGDEPVYFRTGYAGGTPEWGPWQHLVTDAVHGPAIRGSDGRTSTGGTGPQVPSDFAGGSRHYTRYAPRFQTGAELGLPKPYYAVETIIPWAHQSGGGAHQIARGYGETWERYGELTGSTWGPWRVPGGGWQKIAEASPSGGSNVVGNLAFLSIPAAYKRLRIRSSWLQYGTTGNSGNLYLRFNSDTGSNYSGNMQYATTGSWTGTYWALSSTAYAAYNYFYSGSATNYANVFQMDIWNHGKGQTQWKATNEATVGGNYVYRSDVAGFWNSTNAITRIDLWTSNAYTWNSNSVVTLEGSLEE